MGVARARDLANGRALSDETIGRMRSYFARHAVDSQAKGFFQGEPGFPTAGRIAWDLWGGDAGERWVNSVHWPTGRKMTEHRVHEGRLVVYRGVPTYSEKKIRPGDLVTTNIDMATRYAGPHGIVVQAYIQQQELEFYQQPRPDEIEYRYIGDRMRGTVVSGSLQESRGPEPLSALLVATSLRYPRANDRVDGLTVRAHVPNFSSIDGYFADSKTLPGIRVVPMSDLG